LGATDPAGLVQTDDLHPQEVVSGCDTLGDIEVMPSTVLDELINSPCTSVQTFMGNLEPPQAVRASGSGVVDLGQVGHDRALVRRGNRVVRVGVVLRPTNDVTPPCTNTSTSGDIMDGVILVDLLVAGEDTIVDVQDGLWLG